MPRRDDRASLAHMREHAQEAVECVRSRKREDLESDRLLELALTRLIEIVGEAANRLSDEVRSQHSEIPWPQIIGMRNRIVHAYDEVDLDLLWDTVTLELPPLIAQLERLLKC